MLRKAREHRPHALQSCRAYPVLSMERVVRELSDCLSFPETAAPMLSFVLFVFGLLSAEPPDEEA